MIYHYDYFVNSLYLIGDETRNNPFHLKIKSTTSNATGVSLIMRIQSQREDRLPQEKWLDLS